MEIPDESENINRNLEDNKIVVKATDILKKLKSAEDRRNFALENSKK
jgi:hypothetical protein